MEIASCADVDDDNASYVFKQELSILVRAISSIKLEVALRSFTLSSPNYASSSLNWPSPLLVAILQDHKMIIPCIPIHSIELTNVGNGDSGAESPVPKRTPKLSKAGHG